MNIPLDARGETAVRGPGSAAAPRGVLRLDVAVAACPGSTTYLLPAASA